MWSWYDLTEVGMKVLHARVLFDLIAEWKAQGLPPSFVLSFQDSAPKSNHHEKSLGEICAQEYEANELRNAEKEAMEKRLQEITAEKLRLEEEAVKRLKEQKEQARQQAWRTCMRCHSASQITEKYISHFGYAGEPYRLWCTACNQGMDHRYTVQPSSNFMPWSLLWYC